jgi:hypothetical protein
MQATLKSAAARSSPGICIRRRRSSAKGRLSALALLGSPSFLQLQLFRAHSALRASLHLWSIFLLDSTAKHRTDCVIPFSLVCFSHSQL